MSSYTPVSAILNSKAMKDKVQTQQDVSNNYYWWVVGAVLALLLIVLVAVYMYAGADAGVPVRPARRTYVPVDDGAGATADTLGRLPLYMTSTQYSDPMATL